MNSLSSYTPVVSHSFDPCPYNVFVGAAARKLLGNLMGLRIFIVFPRDTRWNKNNTYTLTWNDSLSGPEYSTAANHPTALYICISHTLMSNACYVRKQEHDMTDSTFFLVILV